LETIDSILENRLGNYVLGFIKNGSFVPKYVGRGDVYDRLYVHLDDEYNQPLFKFSYAENETEACKKECNNYHDFKNQLMNKEHPKLPKGKKCPYCSHIGT
jgi:hypothetical protein